MVNEQKPQKGKKCSLYNSNLGSFFCYFIYLFDIYFIYQIGATSMKTFTNRANCRQKNTFLRNHQSF